MNLYQENILDHYKNPRNWGQIKGADKVLEGANASCGDDLIFYLKLDKKQKISCIKWQGRACAISLASASMLSEQIIGKTPQDIQNIAIDQIKKNLGINLSPIRLKCALLPLETLKYYTILQS